MKNREVPYSSPQLNELSDGYWVIEAETWDGKSTFLHDPDLKTVSGFDGAYRYSDDLDGTKELRRHRAAFKKRVGDFVNDRGQFVRITPTYVSVHYAGEMLKAKLGYFPASHKL
jgi:hypothetical protein